MVKAPAGAGPALCTVVVTASERPATAPGGADTAVSLRSGRYAVSVTADVAATLLLVSSSAWPRASTTAITWYVLGTEVLAGMITVVASVRVAPAPRPPMVREPSRTSAPSKAPSGE